SHLVADGVAMFNLTRMTSTLYQDESAWPKIAERLGEDPYDLVGSGVSQPRPGELDAFREMLAGVTRITHEHLDPSRLDGGGLTGTQEQRYLPPDLVPLLRDGSLVATYGRYPVLVAAY